MSSNSQDGSFHQELVLAQQEMRDRMDKYVSAWMSADLDTILSYFVDDGLDYSDYGVSSPYHALFFLKASPTHIKTGLMALHMDKKGLIDYFKFMGAAFGDMDIQTQAVHGAIDFCVWECMLPGPICTLTRYASADLRLQVRLSLQFSKIFPPYPTRRAKGASCFVPALSCGTRTRRSIKNPTTLCVSHFARVFHLALGLSLIFLDPGANAVGLEHKESLR